VINQKDILIRAYKSADWQSICQIHDLARPTELIGSCDPKAFIPIEQDQEVEHLKLCQKLIAISTDRVVGFIGIDQGYIGWLYVHPDFYGQGIGRALLQRGLELVPEKAWTIALAGNSRALNLYQSEGFIEANRYESDNAGHPCTCVRLERNF
jgi:ribosomal protein S18 acetylase RimI-like enzyme